MEATRGSYYLEKGTRFVQSTSFLNPNKEVISVEEAHKGYDIAVESMSRLNKTSAMLMHRYGLFDVYSYQVHIWRSCLH